VFRIKQLSPARARLLTLVVISTAAVSALAACGGDDDGGGGGGDERPTIAFLSQGTSNSWAAQLDAVARKTAKRLGAELVYYNGQGDATKQLPQIQRATARRPDAMVLVPLGAAEDTGPVERAMAAGIKVILCNSTVNTDNYTSLVNPDPATASVPLAEWLAKKMDGRGNLLYIGGLPGNATTIGYDKGFEQVMKKHPEIKVINGGDAKYSISTAKQLTATAIASGKKFDGTWGVGGEAVTGIMQAYADSKVRPIPPNAGAAATNGTLRLAIENDIEAAMLQFPPSDAEQCIETAYKATQGEEVPKHVNVSKLPEFGSIFPPLTKHYKEEYSDDMYVGTDKALTRAELEELNLVK
jgi:ABC-type sugar transport system substrate-binding protein